MKRMLVLFGATLLVVTIIFGTIYVVVQQTIRSDANDPQIEMVQTILTKLDQNTPLVDTIPKDVVQVEKNMSPFAILYDQNGQVVTTNARLADKTPELPKGVLDHAKAGQENRVTWQPRGDVRIAAVVTKTRNGDYYVLSGRNLAEVERRENRTLLLALFGWVISVGILASAFILLQVNPKLLN